VVSSCTETAETREIGAEMLARSRPRTTFHVMNRLVIAGGSGFLGQELIKPLLPDCQEIIVLTRGHDRTDGRVRYVHWDAKTLGGWAKHIDGADAIVNLVGRTVDCRKTDFNKRVILESRVNSVYALAAACRGAAKPPPVWVQSATAHIYGDTGDEVLDESSPTGTGFAPMVGTAWEKALADSVPPGIRTTVLRISFVLGCSGGALQTLARLARCGLGGHTGTGRQWMSWIHAADLNAVIRRAISNERMSGVYVVTAPGPVTNRDFMRELRRAVRRPWSPPVPAPLVRVGAILLRTDPELALYGRRLMPTRLIREGFTFRFPRLPEALADLL
jgi:uncharacterized protein